MVRSNFCISTMPLTTSVTSSRVRQGSAGMLSSRGDAPVAIAIAILHVFHVGMVFNTWDFYFKNPDPLLVLDAHDTIAGIVTVEDSVWSTDHKRSFFSRAFATICSALGISLEIGFSPST